MSASNSAPKARISSELARWRVICAGVLEIVMLAIAPSSALKNPVTRAETRPTEPSSPASTPVQPLGIERRVGVGHDVAGAEAAVQLVQRRRAVGPRGGDMRADRLRAARPVTTRGLKNVSVRSSTSGSIELVFQPSTRAPGRHRPFARRARCGARRNPPDQQLVAADEERPGAHVGQRVAELFDRGLGVAGARRRRCRSGARRRRPTAPTPV